MKKEITINEIRYSDGSKKYCITIGNTSVKISRKNMVDILTKENLWLPVKIKLDSGGVSLHQYHVNS